MKQKKTTPAACQYGLDQEKTCEVLYVLDLRRRALEIAENEAIRLNYTEAEKKQYIQSVSKIDVAPSGLVCNSPESNNRISPDLVVKKCPIRKLQGMAEFKSIYSGKESKSWLDWVRDKNSTKDTKVLQESKTEPGKLVVKKAHPWVQQAECKFCVLAFHIILLIFIRCYDKPIF